MAAITTKEDGATRPGDDASVTKSSMIGGDKIADAESNRDGDVDIGETARVVDTQAERALCRKFDFRLLPVLAVMVRLHYATQPSLCYVPHALRPARTTPQAPRHVASAAARGTSLTRLERN